MKHLRRSIKRVVWQGIPWRYRFAIWLHSYAAVKSIACVSLSHEGKRVPRWARLASRVEFFLRDRVWRPVHRHKVKHMNRAAPPAEPTE